MARINRIPLTLAALSVFVSAHANALGLGDITLHSGLNQPLDAEIALLQTGDMTSDELIAKLASPADYESAGVDRFVFLQNLRFTPVIRNGRGYIKVVSTQPVHEPYLNFLIAVERPNGRLLREYTVLLDPPEYNSANRSVAANLSEAAPSRSSNYRPDSDRAEPVRSAPARPPLPAGDGRYTTVRNDTLWKITSQLSGSGASRAQLMDSIVALNPQAFVNGDPHRLKVGQTLVLPQGQQLAGAGNSAAPASQPAAVAPSSVVEQPASNAPAAATASAQAPVQANAAPAVAGGDANLAKVEADLLLANAQRDQMNQRMDALQKQLESLQQALQSRDQQVQSLQAELDRRQGADAAGSAPAAVAQTDNAPTNAVPAPNGVAPAQQDAAAPSAAQPATPAQEAQGSGFNYWPWVGVGALGALLVGLLFARRKREEKPIEMPPLRAAAPEPVRPLPQAKPLAAAVVAPVPVPHPVVVATPEPGVARLPAASADSLEGADIYIAYGRFNQARDMLRKAVNAEPSRRELRMKLLLVLAELGDVVGFHEEERALVAVGGDQKQIDQLKSRYPAMMIRPEDTLQPPTGETLTDWDDLELGEPVAAPLEQPKAAQDQPDFAMNLSDLSLDLDWDKLDNPFESPRQGKAASKAVQDVPSDFRSNLHELPEITELDLGEHGEMFGHGRKAQVDEDLTFDLPDDISHEHDELLASLDRARQCIDQGNLEEAYGILKQVIASGDSKAKAEARELLALIA
ncbi:FimV/HubP family polar landmark protein [Pseudomonas sp.]|uniref:FimV/HubP family polar landmark protein n=1 Tax=Pseudomonas sp. TaxID=306 RepID=UPI00290C173F|nr:FimV/HubP family polar landmark protein [Pseudomonas sp.]MDU4250535.1 FimV/HubP family polar landmark protein [Pseudomonas sp.]